MQSIQALGRSQLRLCVDLQGPEIRTGFLQDPSKPVKLTTGKEVTLTTDYEAKGTEELIACRQVDHANLLPVLWMKAHFSTKHLVGQEFNRASLGQDIKNYLCTVSENLVQMLELVQPSPSSIGISMQLQEACSGCEPWLASPNCRWLHCA